jgi:hypothetical protein
MYNSKQTLLVVLTQFVSSLLKNKSLQETKTVLERCWRTMYPKDDYVEVVLAGQPDLYGEYFN